MIDNCECGVRGVEPHRMTTWTPRADNDKRGLRSTYRFRDLVTPHNPGDHPPTMGNAEDQALATDHFRQNQALFRKYTAVDGTLKKLNHCSGGTSLPVPTSGPANMIRTSDCPYNAKNLFSSYRTIDEINLA